MSNTFIDDPRVTRRSPQRIAQQSPRKPRRNRASRSREDRAAGPGEIQETRQAMPRQQGSGMQSDFALQAACRHPRSASSFSPAFFNSGLSSMPACFARAYASRVMPPAAPGIGPACFAVSSCTHQLPRPASTSNLPDQTGMRAQKLGATQQDVRNRCSYEPLAPVARFRPEVMWPKRPTPSTTRTDHSRHSGACRCGKLWRL